MQINIKLFRKSEICIARKKSVLDSDDFSFSIKKQIIGGSNLNLESNSFKYLLPDSMSFFAF